MGTRCFVGIQNLDGTVKAIYVHHDGYPSGVGARLAQHYTDREKIDALIAFGDASSIGESLETCYFYGRDNGETNMGNRHYADVDEFLMRVDKAGAECAYLFTYKWLFFPIGYVPKCMPPHMEMRSRKEFADD